MHWVPGSRSGSDWGIRLLDGIRLGGDLVCSQERKEERHVLPPQRTCRGGGGRGACRGGALQGHEQLRAACIEGGGEEALLWFTCDGRGALQGHEQPHAARGMQSGGRHGSCSEEEGTEHAVRRNEGIRLHLQGFPSPFQRLCSEGRRGPLRPWLWPVTGHRRKPGPAGEVGGRGVKGGERRGVIGRRGPLTPWHRPATGRRRRPGPAGGRGSGPGDRQRREEARPSRLRVEGGRGETGCTKGARS